MINKHRKALFCGSFDPFHEGHLFVLKQALKHYDDVFVCISINPYKQSNTLQARFWQVKRFLKTHGYAYIHVLVNPGLSVKMAQTLGCKTLVRGYRNYHDFLYEQALSLQNRFLDPSIKTVLFYTTYAYKTLSSSQIKTKS